MAENIKKSKAGSLNPAKIIDPKEKVRVARKTLLEMKEKLLAEGLGKSLPDNLDASLDIGDEGDRAGNESIRDVSILLSARNKEKLLSIEEALEKYPRGNIWNVRGMRRGNRLGPVESNAPGQVMRNLPIATGKGNGPSKSRRREA